VTEHVPDAPAESEADQAAELLHRRFGIDRHDARLYAVVLIKWLDKRRRPLKLS
jgi:hypothetical protein